MQLKVKNKTKIWNNEYNKYKIVKVFNKIIFLYQFYIINYKICIYQFIF